MHLLIKLWGECVLTTRYLINWTPSFVLNGKTSYEIFYGKSPSYEDLRDLGCCVIHTIKKEKWINFQTEVVNACLLGICMEKIMEII